MPANTIGSIRSRLIIDENGCHLWTGRKSDYGHGKVNYQGREWRVHRLLYEVEFGPVPEGLELDHLCRVPACANVLHLEAVTHQENCRRGNQGIHNKIKTHCHRGHPLEGENLTFNEKGYRRCVTCRKMSFDAWLDSHREEQKAKWRAYYQANKGKKKKANAG